MADTHTHLNFDQNLQRSILLTISYADQFSYPLQLAEIWRRLIVSVTNSVTNKDRVQHRSEQNNTQFSFADVESGVAELVGRGLVVTDGVYFSLSSSGLESDREKKSARAQKKWQEAQQVVHILSWIPWITGIAITGSLAVENVAEDDDIDFLLVTQPNRLWLTRIIVSFLAFISGKRRSWHQEEPNSWCFNLWLDSEHIYIAKHDVYTAHEVCQTQWLLSKDHISNVFLQQNKWAARFLPNYFAHQKVQPVLQFDRFFGSRIVVFSYFFDLLNWLSYLVQRVYMYPHQTTEKVGLGFAFFHPRNTRKIIFDGWSQIIRATILKNKL